MTDNPCLNMAAYAQEALEASDVVVLRCYENGIALPDEWATYRQALRNFLFGTVLGPLADMTQYPA